MSTYANQNDGFNFSATTRHAVARRQLQTSVGAVAVIAMIAVGAALGIRGNTSGRSDQVAQATHAPVIVRAAVRAVPSDRLQANDQSRLDRRS